MGLYQQLVCQIYSSETFDQTGDRMRQLISAAGATTVTTDELSYCTLEFPIFKCFHAYWLHSAIAEMLPGEEDQIDQPRVLIERELLETLHKLVLMARVSLEAAADVFPFSTTELQDSGQWSEVEGIWKDDDLETLRSLEKPLFLFLQHAPKSWQTYYLTDV